MRTIRFRGKASNGEWHYGDLELSPIGKFCRIHEYNDDGSYKGAIDVDPTTVGQFIGVYDKHGLEVYEGDILRYPLNNKTYQVVFKDGIYFGEGRHGWGAAAYFFPSCVILDNIHDNPEMMEKGGNNE